MPLPNYYTALRLFRDLFQTGVPVLTYHKLGPRPSRVRIKGLYLGAPLFARQLAELRTAGFRSVRLGDIPQPTGGGLPRVALTFDDGFRNVLEHGLAPLAQNRFCAIQFLVADQLGKTNEWELALGEAPEPLMDVAQVREWLASGHEIGSHTRTHPFLTRISRSQAREEIRASKRLLEDLFGAPVEHFCYPYGDWNEAVRGLVIEAGYRTACTTDFGVNPPDSNPFALKRITARYPSRNWKAVKARLGQFFQGLGRDRQT